VTPIPSFHNWGRLTHDLIIGTIPNGIGLIPMLSATGNMIGVTIKINGAISIIQPDSIRIRFIKRSVLL
jgi:hypothetical protein